MGPVPLLYGPAALLLCTPHRRQVAWERGALLLCLYNLAASVVYLAPKLWLGGSAGLAIYPEKGYILHGVTEEVGVAPVHCVVHRTRRAKSAVAGLIHQTTISRLTTWPSQRVCRLYCAGAFIYYLFLF